MARKKSKKVAAEKIEHIFEQNEENLETSAEIEMEAADDADVEIEVDSDANHEAEFDGVETDTSIFLQEEEETEGFLPEVNDDEMSMDADVEGDSDEVSVEGTELDGFDSAEIEEVEFVEEERLESIVESVLFASDRPVSLASLKMLFKGTNVRGDKIRRALDQLAVEYAGGRRGVTLEEVPGGYQLRTKIDNMEFLRRTLKARQFKLSGPALEVLSIVAYKQPLVKSEVDEIRGVESGHLLRALMEKNLVCFEGKSELPGRPMQYGTTKKFLEIFGLRSLKELPTLAQIDELLPEGMDEQQAEEKPTLATITDSMSEVATNSYSQGEDELMKIQEQLEDITTSTDFFEQEKQRQAEKRDLEKAQGIRDGLAFGEEVSTRDKNWLTKYDEALAAGTTLVKMAAEKKAAFMSGHKPLTQAPDNSSSTEEELIAKSLSVDFEEKDLEDSSTNDEYDALIAATEIFANEAEASDEEALAEDEDSSDDELLFLGEADDIDEESDANI